MQAEIDGRKEHFSRVREHGNSLVKAEHYASEEVKGMVKQLDSTRLALGGAWDRRSKLLTQCHNLQMFKETAEQADAWLATKEAFLANEDVGVCLPAWMPAYLYLSVCLHV